MKSGFLSRMMPQRIYLFILLFNLWIQASEVAFPAIFQSEFFALPLYRWPPPWEALCDSLFLGRISPDCGSQPSRCHHVVHCESSLPDHTVNSQMKGAPSLP